MVAPQAQLAGDRRRGSARRFPQPDRFDFEFCGELLPLRHRTPPRGYCPLFEVSTKVGLAHTLSFLRFTRKSSGSEIAAEGFMNNAG
jgi:hypothetical protein